MKTKNNMRAIHPGEVLFEEFMKPMGLNTNSLAKNLNVHRDRVALIVNEKRSITAVMALKLARYFGNNAEFWMNLQSAYELKMVSPAVLAEVNKVMPMFSEIA